MRRRSAPLLLARPSRFAGIAQGRARILLALLAALIAASLIAVATPNPDTGMPADGDTDAALYGSIVEHVRHGGGYYIVAADALRAGEYPLRPFVSFRLPTLAIVSAAIPPVVLTGLLWALAAAIALAWYARLAPALARPPARVGAMILLLAGMAAASAPDLAVFHELWAGLLLALSLALYRPGRWVEAAALGVAAALIRETAAVYLLVMLALALRDGARREALGWAAALVVLGVVLGVHAHAVAQVVGPLDAESPGWGGLLGLGFAVRAIVLAGALQLLPLWLAAPLAVLALAGWTAWRSALTTRVLATLAAYLLILATIARGDNYYWALLVAPLSIVGLLLAVDGVRDLVAAALDSRRITVTRVVR